MGKILSRHFGATAVTGIITVILWSVTGSVLAAEFLPSTPLIGALASYQVRPNDSLVELARRFDLGFNAISAANPSVDPWVPAAGSRIVLPTAWILPDPPERRGILINLPELRLYFFPQRGGRVTTFPLGIGDQGRDTPIGSYKVIEKIRNPAWHVPKSLRAADLRLPKVLPPGPDNPLGSHALRLSRADILIHGTNRPWGIGRRSSHGCLRLYPEDMVQLFRLVRKGTPVTVVNRPVKACAVGGKIFLEAHRDDVEEGRVGRAMKYLADKRLLGRADFTKVIRAVEEMKGIPVEVTLVP